MKKLKNISLAVLAGLLIFVMTAVGLPFGMSENTAYAADDKVWPKNPRITRNAAGEIESVDYDTIILGEYNDTPIVWRVLNVDGDKALLFADDVICNREYHPRQWDDPTWGICSLRDWLNGTDDYANGGANAGQSFIDTSFTDEERDAIIETQLETFNRLSINNDSIDEYEYTTDSIFVLSIEDLTNEEYGFPNNLDSTEGHYGIAGSRSASDSYWTRSKGFGEPPSNVVVGGILENKGDISMMAGLTIVSTSWIGVRPAMYVDLTKLGYVKPNVDYTMSGDETKLIWTYGSGKDLTFTIKTGIDVDDSYEHFDSLVLDGKTLTRDKDYTARQGSTIITIKAATLSALSEGEHTINVVFDNGNFESKLTILSAQENITPNTDSEVTPATGDGESIALTTYVLIAATAALSITAFARKAYKSR